MTALCGQVSDFHRIYSGELTAGSYVFTGPKNRRKESVDPRMHATTGEWESGAGGEIVAMVGLRYPPPCISSVMRITVYGTWRPLRFRNRSSPSPLNPRPADGDRLSALDKPSRGKNPTSVTNDPGPARPLFPGCSELHLEVIIDRLPREFKVKNGSYRFQTAWFWYRNRLSNRWKSSREIDPHRPGSGGQYLTAVSGWRSKPQEREGHFYLLSTRSLAALYRRNISPRWRPGLKSHASWGFSIGTRWFDVECHHL